MGSTVPKVESAGVGRLQSAAKQRLRGSLCGTVACGTVAPTSLVCQDVCCLVVWGVCLGRGREQIDKSRGSIQELAPGWAHGSFLGPFLGLAAVCCPLAASALLRRVPW